MARLLRIIACAVPLCLAQGGAAWGLARAGRRAGGLHGYRGAGTVTRAISAGPGRVALSGRLGRRRLPAGAYRLTLRARDAAGNRSRELRLRFTVVRC